MTIFGRPIFYGWVIVGAAFTAQFVAVGVQTSVMAVFAGPILEELEWSRTQLFLADTLGQLILMPVGLALGPYLDRLGPRPIMLVGVAIAAPALVLLSQVDSLWQWLLLRGVFAIVGASMAGFLITSVTVSKWFVAKRGQALGWTSMGVSTAGFVWPSLTAIFIIAPIGWRASWVVLGIVFIVVVAPMAMLMRRRPEDHGLEPDGSRTQVSESQRLAAIRDDVTSLTRSEAVRTPAFYMIVLLFGVSVVGIFAILLHGVLFLTGLGFSFSQAPLLVGAMSLFSLLTKPPWGWALDRFDSRIVGAISFAVASVGFVLVVQAAHTGSVLYVALAMVLMGAGIGGNIPIQEMIWAEYFGRRYLGAVRSLGFPVAMGISAATPVAVAIYADLVGTYDGAFYTCAGLWAASALLCLLLRLPPKRRRVLRAVGRRIAASLASLGPVARPAEQKRAA